jgi:hypothetical protein
MKKYLTYGLLIIVFGLLIRTVVFAQVVQTGSASVQNNVTNTVNGSNCTTHIQTTVNGQTKTLDSTDCGTHTLNNSVSGATTGRITPSGQPTVATYPHYISPTIIIPESLTSTPTPTITEKHKPNFGFFINNFFKKISSLLSRIFNDL